MLGNLSFCAKSGHVLSLIALALCIFIWQLTEAEAHSLVPRQKIVADGISIENLTHGQMAVLTEHRSEIIRLAERQAFTDDMFRRLLNFTQIQYSVCLWGLMPGAISDELSPFNECAHSYLAGARAVLLYMRKLPAHGKQVDELIDKIELEMMQNNAALLVCQYSEEPYNTAEIIYPEWRYVSSHLPSIIAIGSLVFILIGISGGIVCMLRRPSHHNGTV